MVRLRITLVSLLLALLAFELAGRLVVRPAPMAWGTLLGRDLPPLRVLPADLAPPPDPPSRSARPATLTGPTPDDPWWRGMVVKGVKVARSDLWGRLREDPVTGWAIEEYAVSANGWFRSNNLGARRDEDLPRERAPGRSRVLAFGDSYCQGSRLPQEETWSVALETLMPAFEVANFGVDAYSTGQAVLRYEQVRDRLDHDAALFLVPPTVDLWRDISIVRSLASSWKVYTLTPRFVVENGEAALAPRPYTSAAAFYADNRAGLTPGVRSFLRAYDPYYVPALYEDVPLVGRSLWVKLALRAYGINRQRQITRTVFDDPDSEAWSVTRAALRRAARGAAQRQAHVIVALLPSYDDVVARGRRPEFLRSWNEGVRRLRDDGLDVIDLLPPLVARARELDLAYDDSHYGPRASRLVAEALREPLVRLKQQRAAR
ncbi:MAG: hypothetical protein KBD01_11350 [Acidobacteria bacterium]|nr:hypothetical protein [Acidobacteriota bacterium]